MRREYNRPESLAAVGVGADAHDRLTGRELVDPGLPPRSIDDLRHRTSARCGLGHVRSSEGGTTFHFVTDGIESALAQAKAAAGGKDVALWGGGSIIQQYLAAGLLDELELHVVPVLLGDGARIFDDLGNAQVQLEQVRAVEAPGVAHLKYRVVT